MEELTESARQCLVSQGIILGTIAVINAVCLSLSGVVVTIRASDILHFTSLIYLAILEIVCGLTSFMVVGYVWFLMVAYRHRQFEMRAKYLDENMSRGLVALLPPLLLSFATSVVSAIFLLLKTETSSTYDLKSAMSLYSSDMTRKVIIDEVQTILACCGSQSLLDWFVVDWQNSDFDPGIHLINATFTDWDSVPFSCCSLEAPPPCIHHQLRVFGVGSVYTEGCANKLDEAVFIFVILAVVMLCVETFTMLLLMYSGRKLQTSVRSAVMKGDATAPGTWWLLSPNTRYDSEDQIPLLESQKRKNLREDSLTTGYCQEKPNKVIMSPILVTERSKNREKTIFEDWESVKSINKNFDGNTTEEWTRRAFDASASTSTTSFMTSTRPFNSTPDTRHSVSDTVAANLEVSHHLDKKVRPLYRS